MQQLIACSEDSFAFGEPDKIVLRNYDYLLPEDCLPLPRVRHGITDPQYGYRYKLLWDGITSFFSEDTKERLDSDFWADDFRVALVVISDGPLFVDVRRHTWAKDGGRELMPAAGSLHLQFYTPINGTGQYQSYLKLLFEA